MKLLLFFTMTLWLRIIHINDVYKLSNFPNLKTLIDEKSDEGSDRTLIVLAGDFLAPYLLSSLDKGTGMVDCMNAVGVTHVCFGNHETDIPINQIPKRIEQSNFVWVNSNMPDLNEKLGVNTPPYEIIELSDGQQQVTKKVALLGLMTDEPGLYRPGAFGGAKIEPIVPTAKQCVQKLVEQEVDLILPMTHQSIDDDRAFCQHFGGETFPIVLGGHDHTPFDETHNGSRIIKTGQDAENAAIIDLKWESNSDKPMCSAEMVSTADFAPDQAVKHRVQGHLKILHELERARIFRIKNWMDKRIMDCFADKDLPFSTLNNRLGPSLGTTAIASMLRMGMRCHCCLINAGAVRANKVYDPEGYFTFKDLKAEMPFPNAMAVCYIPGSVLQATIAHSRAGAKKIPPMSNGGYLHACDNIKYNDREDRIETVCGKPFDPNQKYLTTLPSLFFKGIDNHEPLLKWAEHVDLQINEDSAIPSKFLMVEVFSALLWLQLGLFGEIDKNSDGVLTRAEVKDRVVEIYGSDVAELVVDNIMGVGDMNGDGTITPLEMMIVQFVATDIIDHVCDEEELKTMKEVAARVLGKDPSHDSVKSMVEKIRDVMDTSRDGKFDREEVMKALGGLKTTDILK